MTEPLHVRGSSLEWKPAMPGIGRIALRDDPATGAQIGDSSLTKGDYYRMPPGRRNSNASKNGCVVLVVTWPGSSG